VCAENIVKAGVNVIVFLALCDDGKPTFGQANAQHLAGLGCPVFACTPDQFPAMKLVALQKDDVAGSAASEVIAAVTAII
jgi:hypothetical protein